jgi:segregation and condensation protein A
MLSLERSDELRVTLPVFEGPMDLLLYLIKKDELDIYDIPIAHITDQYLRYVDLMKMLNLDVAGEFLVMAATLMYIKSRTMLPVEQQPPEDEADEEDPRWDLIRQLVEYKKFKNAADQLQSMALEQEKKIPRIPPEPVFTEPASHDVDEVRVFDLLTAFQRVLARVDEPEDLKEIFEDKFTVADKIAWLQEVFGSRERCHFMELFKESTSRTEVIVTFLALLELIRVCFLRVAQSEVFGEIEVVRL